MSAISTRVTEGLGIEVPLFCGAMYPCSNPELVGAVSAAGALGVVQPLSLIYVHGRDLREGLREIHELAGGRPIGFNAIVERSAKAYERRIRAWVDVALEEGVRFFVTALGNPSWVVDGAHAVGGVVYHDVTERKWADKALEAGVDGLICVNARAGGHAGGRSPEELLAELADLDVPKVCAGGIGDERAFRAALDLGYDAVQMGTRFIATPECEVHEGYRAAICDAVEEDIVLTDKLSGVPVSVIKTPLIERLGPNATGLARRLLRHRRTKHWMRTFYALRSVRNLKRSSLKGLSYKDVWQAGRSVAQVQEVLPAAEVVRRCAAAMDD